MSAAPASPTPPELPVRLALASPESGPQRIDGAWWPRSHDLGRVLPGLLTALDERWPGITRVTVSRSMWRHRPSVLRLPDGRTLHITRSTATPYPRTIRLVSYGVGRCDLLVVPPGATDEEANLLMEQTTTPAEDPAGAL